MARRRFRWLGVLLGLFALLIGLRVALPRILEVGLQRVLSNLFEVRLEIEDVHVTLYEGVIALGAEMSSREGELLARAGELELDIDWGALARGSLRAESFSIVEPEVIVAFDEEDRFNWAGVGGEPSEEPAPAFALAIAELRIGAAVVNLRDDTEGGLPNLRFALGALDLQDFEIERAEPDAPLSWALASADASEWSFGVTPDVGEVVDFAIRASAGPMTDQSIPVEFAVNRPGGVQMEVKAEIRPAPLAVQASLRWSGLRSRAALSQLAVGEYRIERGSLKGDVEVSLTLDDEAAERGLRVSGSATHEDLELQLEGVEPTHVEIERVHIEVAEIFVPIPAEPVDPPAPVLLHLTKFEIDKPSVDLTLEGQGRPTSQPTPEELGEAPPEEEPEVEQATYDLRLDTLSITEGKLRVRDPETGIERNVAIVLDGKGLGWPDLACEQVTLRVSGLAKRPTRVDGTGRGQDADIELSAKRIPLSPWNPLIAHYSDYSVQKGHLSIDGTITLRGDDYEAPLRLVFHKLQAKSDGDAFQRNFGIPMTAALPLLSDTAGNIHLELPIRGTLSQGTQLDVAAVGQDALNEAIRNALGNTVAAPIDVAGSVFRRVGEVFQLGIGEAAFSPGESELPIDAKAVLQSAAQFVKSTPRTRMELVPEIVRDDCSALGVDVGGGGAGEAIATFGRALFGGGREIDDAARARIEPLANRRVAVVARYLTEQAGFPAERIVRKPWNGMLAEGFPRVLLRMNVRGK